MKNYFLILIIFYSCSKEKSSDFTPQTTTAPNHHANQHANAAVNDSACALQSWYQFPPMGDSIYYQTLLYNTGLANYSNGVFTIIQNGNFIIEATAYRYALDSADLILKVNGIPIYDTGMLLQNYYSISVSVLLFNGDEVYVSTTAGGNTVEPNGIFKLSR